LPSSTLLAFNSPSHSLSLLVLTAVGVSRACCRFCSGSAMLTVSSLSYYRHYAAGRLSFEFTLIQKYDGKLLGLQLFRTSLGACSFSVAGPKIWNSCPSFPNVHLPSYFLPSSKTYLFQLAFQSR